MLGGLGAQEKRLILYNQLPDLESLRCFVAAAQTKNFREAAKIVHLSPSAFSERIVKIEEQLGFILFIRNTRQISLSEEGSRLLQHATELLQQAQDFQSKAIGKHTDVTLTLGTRYELGLSYLLPLLEKLEHLYPFIHIHLFFGDTVSLTSALLSSQIDFVFSSMRIDHPMLQIHTTHVERYVLVGKHSLAQKIQKKKDLIGHTLVDISPSFPLFRYFAEPQHIQPEKTFGKCHFLGTISALLYWILQHDSMAVLPLYFVEPYIQKGELAIILPQQELQYDYFRFVWKHNHWAEKNIIDISKFIQTHPLQ